MHMMNLLESVILSSLFVIRHAKVALLDPLQYVYLAHLQNTYLVALVFQLVRTINIPVPIRMFATVNYNNPLTLFIHNFY